MVLLILQLLLLKLLKLFTSFANVVECLGTLPSGFWYAALRVAQVFQFLELGGTRYLLNLHLLTLLLDN